MAMERLLMDKKVTTVHMYWNLVYKSLVFCRKGYQEILNNHFTVSVHISRVSVWPPLRSI